MIAPTQLIDTNREIKRRPRWFFGGLASGTACLITHPFDLLKVHLQTAKSPKEFDLHIRIKRIIKIQGYTALYNGLTASLFRQATYSTTRFGAYGFLKDYFSNGNKENLTFAQKLAIAAASGALGGLVGTPAEIVNVRMQNDIKLPNDMRRGYHHVVDGMRVIYQYEGARALFTGSHMTVTRAALMTIGQLCMYDQYKSILLNKTNGVFGDNFVTHILASLFAGATATTLTLPLDVVKTRFMNETKGHYKGIFDVAKTIFREHGVVGFYKGFVPAFLRLGPHTVITFFLIERWTKSFGIPTLENPLPTLDAIDDSD